MTTFFILLFLARFCQVSAFGYTIPSGYIWGSLAIWTTGNVIRLVYRFLKYGRL